MENETHAHPTPQSNWECGVGSVRNRAGSLRPLFPLQLTTAAQISSVSRALILSLKILAALVNKEITVTVG